MKTQGLRTIGLLGGMSPESTVDYYQRINEGVRKTLGGHHSCPILAYSANLEEILHWFATENDEALGEHLMERALGLERAGAEFMLIACNTAHKVAPRIAAALAIPLIHIVDVLGEALAEAGHTRVALLGSALIMERPFYRQRLWDSFGVEALVPDLAQRGRVDRIIRNELCFHTLKPESRGDLEAISAALGEEGAQAVVLACTELGLLLKGDSVAGLPLFDTTGLHTERATALALGCRDLPRSSRVA